MKRLMALTLAATIACSVAISATAAPWVKKASVDGRYAGKWVETECTYTNCDQTPSRQRLNWRFTPTRRGVELYSLTGDYTMNLRWLPRGEYTGTADSGRRWKRLIEFTVTKQVQLGHTVESPPGADQGVDIVASRDPLGLEQRVKVQVKARPNSRSGAPELVQLAGNVGSSGERGMFVSTGGFTREAEAHPAAQSISRVDGQRLRELVLTYYEELDGETRALVPLKRLYFPVA